MMGDFCRQHGHTWVVHNNRGNDAVGCAICHLPLSVRRMLDVYRWVEEGKRVMEKAVRQ